VKAALIQFIVRRILISLIVLLLVTMMVFASQRLLPGDPVRIWAGEEQDPESLTYLRHKYKLDQPIPMQYLTWLGLALQGDLGQSIRTGIEVRDEIVRRLPITIELSLLAMLIAVMIALPGGVISAVRKDTWWDYLSNSVALFGLSVPNFWLGIMLILWLAVQWHWLPASGYVSPLENLGENLRRMIMPAFVLGTGLSAVLMRQIRSSLLEVLKADYVRTARSKGLSEPPVITKHALRNALIPAVTVLGLQAGALFGGAIITEQVFVIPGFGKYSLDGVFSRDYAQVQAVVLVTALGYLLINLAVDIAYSIINPKIRIEGAESE
jgi:peptide/nickel transport system permease protein